MAKTAWDSGATEEKMSKALQLIRQAQWRWDFVVASHGGSFHAPVETQRILAHSLDRTLQSQLELQAVLFALGVSEVKMPDVSSKSKAQQYIGLDMQKLRSDKDEWNRTTLPGWIEKAKNEGKIVSAI